MLGASELCESLRGAATGRGAPAVLGANSLGITDTMETGMALLLVIAKPESRVRG